MQWFVSVSMAIILLSLLGLIRLGGKGLKKKLNQKPETWPGVSVIVPATGDSPGLRAALTSLLDQDYPDFELIVVVNQEDDPAWPLVREITHGRRRIRTAAAGPSQTCGQKNHNLLTGYGMSDPDHKVLIFCDSTRIAQRDFFRELVRPLAIGKARVSSGYYLARPQDQGLFTQAQTVLGLVLYLTRGISLLMQTWGGGTCIQRALFEELGVPEMWGENVVDDVSLAAHLARNRIRVASAIGAIVTLPLSGITGPGLVDWYTRQLQYLRFCFPGTWIASVLYCYIFGGLVLVSPIWFFGGLAGCWNGYWPLVSGLFLTALALATLELRVEHPHPGPRLRWVAACLTALAVACIGQTKTALTRKIMWRGVGYLVGKKGKVLKKISR